jgi:hypothetical protein
MQYNDENSECAYNLLPLFCCLIVIEKKQNMAQKIKEAFVSIN